MRSFAASGGVMRRPARPAESPAKRRSEKVRSRAGRTPSRRRLGPRGLDRFRGGRFPHGSAAPRQRDDGAPPFRPARPIPGPTARPGRPGRGLGLTRIASRARVAYPEARPGAPPMNVCGRGGEGGGSGSLFKFQRSPARLGVAVLTPSSIGFLSSRMYGPAAASTRRKAPCWALPCWVFPQCRTGNRGESCLLLRVDVVLCLAGQTGRGLPRHL